MRAGGTLDDTMNGREKKKKKKNKRSYDSRDLHASFIVILYNKGPGGFNALAGVRGGFYKELAGRIRLV